MPVDTEIVSSLYRSLLLHVSHKNTQFYFLLKLSFIGQFYNFCTVKKKINTLLRRGSTLGQGAVPPNLGLLPRTKWDMKHCLTNSKHQHIGAKRSVLWPPNYAKLPKGGSKYEFFVKVQSIKVCYKVYLMVYRCWR